MWLLIFTLFLSFVAINSSCSRNSPRKEGFLREPCIPGIYDGSCIIILDTMTLHEAMEKCRYDYGGRLATAPTADTFKFWTRTIHFSTKVMDENHRFWIGYGKYGFQDEKPTGEMANFIDRNVWDRVFNRARFYNNVEWEIGANENRLDDSDCPMKGVIFNPINQKFDVKNAAQEHHSLCETPRWAKLQCHSGWHLVPQIRMCLRVHEKFTNFLEAHAFCNVKGSFIATAQNGNESDMLRSVINPYNLKNGLAGGVGGFWTGVKAEALTTFSMDGTKPTFKVEGDDPNAKGCGAITFRPFIADGREFGGEIVSCKKERDYDFWELPFMCQNFADQSLANNI